MSPLSAEQVITVRALADACAESDGTRPLNEQALLQLDDGERARHHLALAGTEIVGYAQGDPRLGPAFGGAATARPCGGSSTGT